MDPFDLQLWPVFLSAGGEAGVPAIIDQVCIDSRRVNSKNSLFVALEGTLDGHEYVQHAAKNGAKYALVKKSWSPSINIEGTVLLRVANPLRALQSLATAYRQSLKCKLIAICGTHGKTMVKDFLCQLVEKTVIAACSPESFNSQIGVALSLFTLNRRHEVALIEAAFSQRDEMEKLAMMLQPEAVIVTHLGKKHLATLGSLEASAEEMLKLLMIPQNDSWVLLPHSPQLETLRHKIKAQVYHWGHPGQGLPHTDIVGNTYSDQIGFQINFPDGCHYQGTSNCGFSYFQDFLNITVKAAWLLDVPSNIIHEQLAQFSPEPMRTEIWQSPSGITFFNDAYCSDPQSIDKALKLFDQVAPSDRKIFVFSGMRGKQQGYESDFRRVGEAIARAKPQLLLLVGPQPFKPLIDEICSNGLAIEIVHTDSSSSAIELLQQRIKAGDAILIKGERKIPMDLFIDAFNDSLCINQCNINLETIRSNIAAIRSKLTPSTEIMVIVKALAYGTDDVRIAKFLANCGIRHLGVAYTDEAVALKRAGVTQELFVIHAAPFEAGKVAKWGLTVGVSDLILIIALAEAAANLNKILKVHLHIDTGMGRFGCRPEEALTLASLIQNHPNLKLDGIMTHFAGADDPAEDEFTRSQVASFDKTIANLQVHGIDPHWKHASNSSAAARFKLPQYNLARIGLAAYGLYASEAVRESLELKRAHSLLSRIVAINRCHAGESISYGRTYTVQRDHSRIAVLPIGYFDGLHRKYSGKGHVVIRGKPAPMIGKICMDFMMVDITDIPEAMVGDCVLIFGRDEYGHYLSPEELAGKGDSIVHELITCLGPRIQRIFIHEESNEN